MDQQTDSSSVTRPGQSDRWHALIDLLYLNQVVFLYLFSAIYPFMGLFYGILYMAGSQSPKAKHIGRVCLILGIINLAVMLVAGGVILALALTGVFAGTLGKN
ncbi:MAG: hypothetical protein ABIK37_06490 [candidate division WOR-3 bacterium]